MQQLPNDCPKSKFKPRGSWTTEDLVLPTRNDPRRVPTMIVRARGVFSNQLDLPESSGLLNDRETEIVRPRSHSDLSPRSDTLPIDRSTAAFDPAEGPASLSAEIRLQPRRSFFPVAVGALLFTLAAAAFAMAQYEPDSDPEVRQPVLIAPEPETTSAALD